MEIQDKAKSKDDKPVTQLIATPLKSIVKVTIPDRGSKPVGSSVKTASMLDRGYVYLKRFKNLSKAFQTGNFKAIPNLEVKQAETVPGPWQKVF